MKLQKIFAISLAALAFTACSDDDDFTWNTAKDVTVEMGETEVNIKENKGLVSIPLVVKGNPNGYVQVTIDVVEPAEDPAIETQNYLITSRTINISPDDKTADIEIMTINRPDEDPTVSTIIRIASVKHASIGTPDQMTLTIRDKGVSPRPEAVAGTYKVSYIDYDGAETEFECDLVMIDPATGECELQNFLETSFCKLPMTYRYDPVTKYGDFYITYGAVVATDVNFTNLGVRDIQIGNASGNIHAEGGVEGVFVDEEYKIVSFGKTKMYLMITQNNNTTGYLYDSMENLTLTRK